MTTWAITGCMGIYTQLVSPLSGPLLLPLCFVITPIVFAAKASVLGLEYHHQGSELPSESGVIGRKRSCSYSSRVG